MVLLVCRSRAVLPLLVLALTWGPLSAAAQELVFEADAAQTRVEFTLGASFHTVHGSFRLSGGEIRFDPTTGAAGGELVVDATSGNTGNSSRDKKMHQEILESQRAPEIRFTVQQVRGTVPAEGLTQVQLEGIMTLHGGQHKMTITAAVQVNQGSVTADAHSVVPYVQWGLKNPSSFFLRVSDRVDITVHAVGRVTTAAATASQK
jgi:polyisoprenoid-binding protein YceI